MMSFRSMEALFTTTMSTLSSLTTWCHQHINAIFEASTDSAALKAAASTFTPTIHATLNNKPLHREEIDELILMLRKGEGGVGRALKVKWISGVEEPSDNTHRVGRQHVRPAKY